MTSCDKQPEKIPPSDPVEIELTIKQKEVVVSENRFAFDLFKPVVAGETAGKNIMISSFSITSALSMTLNGAAGGIHCLLLLSTAGCLATFACKNRTHVNSKCQEQNNKI